MLELTEEELTQIETANSKTRIERQGTASQWHIGTVFRLTAALRKAYEELEKISAAK